MSDQYNMTTQSMLRVLVSAHASANETLALMALMHHGPNDDGEIGVSAEGYVMSARDIAQFVPEVAEGDVDMARMPRALDDRQRDIVHTSACELVSELRGAGETKGEGR